VLASRHFAPLILSVFVAACAEEPKPERLPPPPAASAKASACAAGGGQSDDAASAAFFPRVTGAFCLDPNSGAKTFGEGGKKPIDRICDLFDGECELYLRLGVSRVVELRYVSGAGSPATVDVYLSRFASSEAAYAMFTTRVVGDGDPADEATPKPTPGGGAAALGLGNGYVWRGPYLLEVTYNDETASEKTLRGAADAVLPKLLEEVGALLPGDTALPAAVRLLPSEGRLPHGVRFLADKVFGLGGVSGAFGYYRAGAQRFRVAALVRGDEAQAKDTLASLGKMPGATTEKDGTVRVMVGEEGGAKAEWLFARRKQDVLGIGDEVRVLRPGMPAEEAAALNLPKADKAARLAKLLAN
jgi:hypothetical protein